eukprot:2086534-Rhodomonas_salina.1
MSDNKENMSLISVSVSPVSASPTNSSDTWVSDVEDSECVSWFNLGYAAGAVDRQCSAAFQASACPRSPRERQLGGKQGAVVRQLRQGVAGILGGLVYSC